MVPGIPRPLTQGGDRAPGNLLGPGRQGLLGAGGSFMGGCGRMRPAPQFSAECLQTGGALGRWDPLGSQAQGPSPSPAFASGAASPQEVRPPWVPAGLRGSGSGSGVQPSRRLSQGPGRQPHSRCRGRSSPGRGCRATSVGPGGGGGLAPALSDSGVTPPATLGRPGWGAGPSRLAFPGSPPTPAVVTPAGARPPASLCPGTVAAPGGLIKGDSWWLDANCAGGCPTCCPSGLAFLRHCHCCSPWRLRWVCDVHPISARGPSGGLKPPSP